MDAASFDRLTKAISSGSRRWLLAGIGPGLGALALWLAPEPAAAKKGKKRKKRRKKNPPTPEPACLSNTNCPGCQTCSDGVCIDIQPLCDRGNCEEPFCDPDAKAWRCERTCPWFRAYCENGRCTSCPPDWVRCPDNSCDDGDCCCMPGLVCGCRKNICCKADGTGCEGC